MTTTKRGQVVLFPLESANREIDYRVVLAARVADDLGVPVVLAQQDVLHGHAELFGGGVFVGQNVKTSDPTGRMNRYRRLKQLGMNVVFLDEEGGVFPGDDKDTWAKALVRRFDANDLDVDDVLCTWGDFQRDVYAATHPKVTLLRTGHPRFDLLKQKYRRYFDEPVSDIHREIGARFVLVNTSFARANHARGVDAAFSAREGYDVADVEHRVRTVDTWALQTRGMVNVVQLVHHLVARDPGLRVVVRPHPTENPDTYRTIFGGLDAVRVLARDTVIPWIIASGVVVYDGCTTGIEAYGIGAATLMYRPGAGAEGAGGLDIGLPTRVGQRCATVDEVAATAAAAFRGAGARRPLPGADAAVFHDLIANYLDDSVDGFDAVTEAIGRYTGAAATADWFPALVRQERERSLQMRARGMVRRLRPARQRAYEVHRGKFQGFSRTGLASRVERARAALGVDVGCSVLSDDVAVVWPRRLVR